MIMKLQFYILKTLVKWPCVSHIKGHSLVKGPQHINIPK